MHLEGIVHQFDKYLCSLSKQGLIYIYILNTLYALKQKQAEY